MAFAIDRPAAERVVVAWRDGVLRRKGTVIRTGAKQLAARFGTRAPYVVELAPAAVQRADTLLQTWVADQVRQRRVNAVLTPAVRAAAPVTGAVSRTMRRVSTVTEPAARAAEAAVRDAVAGAASLPRKTIAAVLGIPEWMVPVLVIGAGYVVLTQLVPPAPLLGRR